MTRQTSFENHRDGWLVSSICVFAMLAVSVWAQETKDEAKPAPTPTVTETKPADADSAATATEEPGLRGYCPAAYLLLGKPMKGSAEFKVRYQATMYYLSSAEAKQKFEDDPTKYLPQFGGLCTTALGGSYGNRLESDPEVFDVRDGKVYLFSSERAKRAYDKLPRRFILGGERVFSEPALEGLCPVAFQTQRRPVRGNKDLTVIYKGWLYRLSSGEAKLQFERNPELYLPQYDAHCAEGVSRGKLFKGDLTKFVVRGDRTFLFFDDEARTKFMASPEAVIKAADEYWKVLADQQ